MFLDQRSKTEFWKTLKWLLSPMYLKILVSVDLNKVVGFTLLSQNIYSQQAHEYLHVWVFSLPACSDLPGDQSVSPVIVRKLGPPLLAGESASRGEDFPSVVFSFTHDALSDIHFTMKKKKKEWKTANQAAIHPIDLFNVTCESHLSSHKGHSWRFSSPLRCSHHPPRAGVYRWQSDESHS